MNPFLNLGEHLALLPTLHTEVSKEEALANLTPLLVRLHLPIDPAFLSRFPHQISGGQRQRVCLAMALSCDPELLILDEPTAALDPLVQKEFLDLMLDLQRDRGLGFLWITHDLAVASVVCDRLLVLYGGEPLEMGPTQALLTAPRHPYTTRLLEAARHQPSEESGFLLAPQDRPIGCPFQPRCSFRQTSCTAWKPWQSHPDCGPISNIPDFGFRCEQPMGLPD
jgi:oligopeptide/dipeptide ABC transporter ATP-binding protein